MMRKVIADAEGCESGAGDLRERERDHMHFE